MDRRAIDFRTLSDKRSDFRGQVVSHNYVAQARGSTQVLIVNFEIPSTVDHGQSEPQVQTGTSEETRNVIPHHRREGLGESIFAG